MKLGWFQVSPRPKVPDWFPKQNLYVRMESFILFRHKQEDTVIVFDTKGHKGRGERRFRMILHDPVDFLTIEAAPHGL